MEKTKKKLKAITETKKDEETKGEDIEAGEKEEVDTALETKDMMVTDALNVTLIKEREKMEEDIQEKGVVESEGKGQEGVQETEVMGERKRREERTQDAHKNAGGAVEEVVMMDEVPTAQLTSCKSMS